MNRQIKVEGAYNIRDLGGYQTKDGRYTKWRRMIRADNTDQLPRKSREELKKYGVSVVIDLRSTPELERWPDPFARDSEVVYEHRPVYHDEATFNDIYDPSKPIWKWYAQTLEKCKSQLGAILTAVALHPDSCVLFHCAGGKDRTGIVSALLLGLVCVSDAVIARDYALSAKLLEPRIRKWQSEALERGADMNQFVKEVSSDPVTMTRTLDYVSRRFGGIGKYVGQLQIDDGVVNALSSSLVGE